MGCRIKPTEKKTPLFLIGTTRLRVAGVQRGTGHTQGLVLHKDSSRGERSHAGTGRTKRIDLFTNTAAILNLIDLRSITRCPGGTHSVFTRTFRANRELHCIFLGKKAIIITSKHGTTIFFSHYNLFLGKLQDKLARKARVTTERVYWIVLITPPGHPIILLKSYKFNMAPYR